MNGSGAYALLAVPFFAVTAVVAVVAGIVAARRARAAGRAPANGRRVAVLTSVIAGVALLLMTVVFDNVIVTLRIVAYDPALISGAKIGAIPVEDLAYAVSAIVLLPSLWVLFDRTGGHGRTGARDRSGARPAPDPTTAPAEDPK
ncbi:MULTISPECIES: lycopene cyclase domain-containing protein [Curtobacterium]|uniref:lycopene cyclase domain-containing protein n=1 Tax=Curtobacterium TaxID=2034 RepID=UPI0018E5601D|nr:MULTISPECIES: lycopene cyclase domain-containing protein [Curtobacterium]MCA5922394.1 lycopene cyclase domain-containing protein [Curtobacterium oceanosedimentum]QQD76570.1 lycopene cyclase domain-containing protein [Curtobacterium sp. YC1]